MGGMWVIELNQLEIEFLFSIDFNLCVTQEDYSSCVDELLSLAAARGAQKSPEEVGSQVCSLSARSDKRKEDANLNPGAYAGNEPEAPGPEGSGTHPPAAAPPLPPPPPPAGCPTKHAAMPESAAAASSTAPMACFTAPSPPRGPSPPLPACLRPGRQSLA